MCACARVCVCVCVCVWLPRLIPPPHTHRPLLFYVLMEAMHYMSAAALLAMGFSRTIHQGTTFYYKPAAAGPKQQSPGAQPPILFLHGVGMGLLIYIQVGRGLFLGLVLDQDWHISCERLVSHSPAHSTSTIIAWCPLREPHWPSPHVAPLPLE